MGSFSSGQRSFLEFHRDGVLTGSAFLDRSRIESYLLDGQLDKHQEREAGEWDNRAFLSEDRVHLSVVIPVRNEAENILPLLAEIHAALEGRGEFEVVYVDDGSTDATPAAAGGGA